MIVLNANIATGTVSVGGTGRRMVSLEFDYDKDVAWVTLEHSGSSLVDAEGRWVTLRIGGSVELLLEVYMLASAGRISIIRMRSVK